MEVTRRGAPVDITRRGGSQRDGDCVGRPSSRSSRRGFLGWLSSAAASAFRVSSQEWYSPPIRWREWLVDRLSVLILATLCHCLHV